PFTISSAETAGAALMERIQATSDRAGWLTELAGIFHLTKATLLIRNGDSYNVAASFGYAEGFRAALPASGNIVAQLQAESASRDAYVSMKPTPEELPALEALEANFMLP